MAHEMTFTAEVLRIDLLADGSDDRMFVVRTADGDVAIVTHRDTDGDLMVSHQEILDVAAWLNVEANTITLMACHPGINQAEEGNPYNLAAGTIWDSNSNVYPGIIAGDWMGKSYICVNDWALRTTAMTINNTYTFVYGECD